MRSDSKTCGPIVHVLNGFYPEADLCRMNVDGLEQLVAALVRCTTPRADKPEWWPTTIAYNSKINLGLEDEQEIELALKKLIVDCSQFFNRERDAGGEKWSVGWNDENQQKKWPRLRPRLPVPLLPIPFVRLERPRTAPADLTKHQFLHYFRLNPKRCKIAPKEAAPLPLSTLKLTNCSQIPFSSNVGRLLAAREQHGMSENLKLKRLERNEWYTNKETKTVEIGFETAPVAREEQYCHNYKMPRRQFHQRRPGMYDAEFLAKFCTPVCVRLERLDLDKVRGTGKELVVLIDKKEQMCCDVKANKTKVVRTSPRLRNV